jgi:hypothetical protein
VGYCKNTAYKRIYMIHIKDNNADAGSMCTWGGYEKERNCRREE